VQRRFGDRGYTRVGRVVESERTQHPLLHDLGHRLTGDLLHGQPQDHVIGVGVVPVRARRWDLLIRRRGYSPQTYQAWVEDTLAAALLHPSLL
jgi:hypothetical protein